MCLDQLRDLINPITEIKIKICGEIVYSGVFDVNCIGIYWWRDIYCFYAENDQLIFELEDY